ncbi:indole-3-glycerol phosphate synthase TrpC [Gangjinia marincola]|uniref:indole-3-glycerol-phosphate synthase n=1 Tax=Gangjinia marincola TaxID=578463 RepID=A0ABN1MJJ7_9FLAO
MRNILDQIVADKRKEVHLRKQVLLQEYLEKSPLFERTPIRMADTVRASTTGIIAEFKRRSPSKSVINQNANVQDVAQGYEEAGFGGMSVLTDGKYFGGSLDDLILARASCSLPLLRKEFIIDEYQILTAKAYGADCILLIAAVLSAEEIKHYSAFAGSLGLSVLCEIHGEDELQKTLVETVDMIGVNNRNLKTFEVDIATSKNLADQIPKEFLKVSESGISDPRTIVELMPYGFEGFLIGECFMKEHDPALAAFKFAEELKTLHTQKSIRLKE